ncbi:MAG: NAD(P)/FAD-dependent oxidoreductase [Burkholderiaceae bacterium]
MHSETDTPHAGPREPCEYDALIIGGGHNGLVCACDLAAQGLKVRVLERRAVLGGAAVTEEFHPGFRNSTASYTVSLLDPGVIADLRLAEHGLRIVERPFSNFLPLPDGRSLKLGGSLADSQKAVAEFSSRDALRLPAYYAMLDRSVALLRTWIAQTPPNVGERGFGSWRDWLGGLRIGRQLTGIDLEGKRDLLALFARSAGDLLDSWFESSALKAVLGFDAIVGNFASPYASGSAYVLLHHVFGGVNGKPGIWGHAIGGMGAITQAMASEAVRRGVTFSVSSPVASVKIERGRAIGVELEDGRELRARRIVANVTPRVLFAKLVAPEHLSDSFLSRIAQIRFGSGTLRMNVALSELPDFNAQRGTHAQPHHASGMIFAPSLAYMERAWSDARLEGFSREPVVEMLIPSTVDDSLAPAGQHVASLFCQHFSPQLDAARFPRGWDDARELAADAAIDTVNRFAPNFRASILARQVHTPLDLERKFGLTEGDIFHGALTPDQIFSARPVLGHANYRTPILGLYLCGSGAHPGGGVTGLPGRNAAREILRDRS